MLIGTPHRLGEIVVLWGGVLVVHMQDCQGCMTEAPILETEAELWLTWPLSPN